MLSVIFLLILLAVVGIAAIPLVLGVVPPNPYYGWPTRSSSSKPELWKEANKVFGIAVLVAVAIAALAIMLWNGTWLKSGFAQLFVVIFALAAAVATTFVLVKKMGG